MRRSGLSSSTATRQMRLGLRCANILRRYCSVIPVSKISSTTMTVRPSMLASRSLCKSHLPRGLGVFSVAQTPQWKSSDTSPGIPVQDQTEKKPRPSERQIQKGAARPGKSRRILLGNFQDPPVNPVSRYQDLDLFCLVCYVRFELFLLSSPLFSPNWNRDSSSRLRP